MSLASGNVCVQDHSASVQSGDQRRAPQAREFCAVGELHRPWSVDRWGRLLAGLSGLLFAALGLAHHPLWTFGALAVAGNLLLTSLTDRCPVRAVLLRLGAREREDLFHPGGRLRTSLPQHADRGRQLGNRKPPSDDEGRPMRSSDLSQPNLVPWLAAATLDWLVILATAALVVFADSLWLWPAAVLVIGNRQHALSILGHDGGHRLVSRRKWLNDVLTNLLCFWPLGVGIHGYRKFHFAHHRLTGTAGDPELELKRLAKPLYDLPAAPGSRVWQFCKDLVGGGIPEMLDLVRHVRPLTRGDRFGPLFWWVAAGGGCAVMGWWQAVLLWFGALLTTYWATFRLRIWTEHLGTSETHRVQLGWWQRLLFAPHNTWYHYEHHRWPAVPYSRLPELRVLDPEVPVLPVQELFAWYGEQGPLPSGQAAASAHEGHLVPHLEPRLSHGAVLELTRAPGQTELAPTEIFAEF